MSSFARRPTRKEIVRYYKTHRSRFLTPEQIHVWQIVKNLDETVDPDFASATIQTALSELKTGAAFSTVADQHSDCGGDGGELGWIERGAMVEEFERAVFDLPVGKYSPVFQTRFGFHIALVAARRGPGFLPLAAVYDHIANLLSSSLPAGKP